MNTHLFQSGDFTLRSGVRSRWKLECDAFTDRDWETLAAMAAEILPPFGTVHGVPRGGVPFALELMKHATNDVATSLPILIAEDVCTSGGSMERMRDALRANCPGQDIIGVCVFARGVCYPSWVTPLFTLNPLLHRPNPTAVLELARDPHAETVEPRGPTDPQ